MLKTAQAVVTNTLTKWNTEHQLENLFTQHNNTSRRTTTMQ